MSVTGVSGWCQWLMPVTGVARVFVCFSSVFSDIVVFLVCCVLPVCLLLLFLSLFLSLRTVRRLSVCAPASMSSCLVSISVARLPDFWRDVLFVCDCVVTCCSCAVWLVLIRAVLL